MFVWKNKSGGIRRTAEVSGAYDGCVGDVRTGLVAGTKVATSMGWRAVEALAVGDRVLTFDGGLQVVIELRRQQVWACEEASYDSWPLNVPAGALGNREAMTLLPEQSVLVESDMAEEVFGDPFVLIPAAALDGFRGISRGKTLQQIEVISLHFASDQVVFANIGALFLCPRAGDIISDIFEEVPVSSYSALSMEDAGILVGFLQVEDEGYKPNDQRVAVAAVA